MELAHIEVVAQALCDEFCVCESGCNRHKERSGAITGAPWIVARDLLAGLERKGFKLVKKDNE